MDGAHTVMAVDRCGDYRYDFTDGTYQVVPVETFEETEWSVRLLMEGKRQMEHNRNNRAAETENVSLECDDSDWSAAVMVDFLDEDNAEMLADRELRRLYVAMSKLTERQLEILQLYFYKGMNQYEIAEELGICQQSVNRIMNQAVKRLRKKFKKVFRKVSVKRLKKMFIVRGLLLKYMNRRSELTVTSVRLVCRRRTDPCRTDQRHRAIIPAARSW